MSRLVARGSASLAHSLKMTAGFVGGSGFARGCSEDLLSRGYRHDHVWTGAGLGKGLKEIPEILRLTTPAVAITFPSGDRTGLPPVTKPTPPPTPDGRTGRVPAGCVFWVKAAELDLQHGPRGPRQEL